MKLNIIALPFLDQPVLDAVFSVALGDEETLNAIHDVSTRDFTDMLLTMAHYNVKYRSLQLKKLVPTLQEVFGDADADPEGAALALGVVLAIKELYGMRPDTLKAVMRQVTVRG
jgi:hypothetical protein